MTDRFYRNAPPPRVARSGGVPAYLSGCLIFLIGILLGIVGVVAAFFFLVGQAASNQQIPRNDPNAPYDTKIDIAQKYLNDEVATALAQNPPSIPLVTVKQVILNLQDNDQIKVTARLSGFGRDIDMSLIDQVALNSNGDIVLKQIGNATIANFVQFDTSKVVNVINETIIAAQLNQNIKSIKVDGRGVKLATVNVRSGFLTVGVTVVR